MCNGELKAFARRGADNVRVMMDFEGQEGFTVMTAISKEHTLHVWLLKGTIAQSEEPFRTDARLRQFLTNHRLILKHAKNGWMNQRLAIKFLKFVSSLVGRRNCYLMWDIHRSQRTDAVKDGASQLGIGL